jgi:hypothetical protein
MLSSLFVQPLPHPNLTLVNHQHTLLLLLILHCVLLEAEWSPVIVRPALLLQKSTYSLRIMSIKKSEMQ